MSLMAKNNNNNDNPFQKCSRNYQYVHTKFQNQKNIGFKNGSLLDEKRIYAALYIYVYTTINICTWAVKGLRYKTV